MKYSPESEAIEFPNGRDCTVWEYPRRDPDIHGSVGRIHGRYPEVGFAVNREVKELIYVISGAGVLATHAETFLLEPGGMGIIEPGETYYLEGSELKLFMATTPAWTPEQHEIVE